MISVLYERDKITNAAHKFGETKLYYPVQVVFEDGRMQTAFFTEAQVQTALDRAMNNFEDVEALDAKRPKPMSWWRRLLFGVI